tara:strand:- start:2695 stop:3927 length:1233 start_codon:yes stop_codon:yes gene_type:complete
MSNLKYFLLNGYQEYNYLMMGGALDAPSTPDPAPDPALDPELTMSTDDEAHTKLFSEFDKEHIDQRKIRTLISGLNDRTIINKVNHGGLTLLHYAVLHKKSALIRFLLSNKGDPNIKGPPNADVDYMNETTPFEIYLLGNTIDEMDLGIIKLFIEKKARLDTNDTKIWDNTKFFESEKGNKIYSLIFRARFHTMAEILPKLEELNASFTNSGSFNTDPKPFYIRGVELYNELISNLQYIARTLDRPDPDRNVSTKQQYLVDTLRSEKDQYDLHQRYDVLKHPLVYPIYNLIGLLNGMKSSFHQSKQESIQSTFKSEGSEKIYQTLRSYQQYFKPFTIVPSNIEKDIKKGLYNQVKITAQEHLLALKPDNTTYHGTRVKQKLGDWINNIVVREYVFTPSSSIRPPSTINPQ